MSVNILHVNPDGLHSNPAFTQMVTVQGATKLAFVGGQNSVNGAGEIVGGNLREQTAQALLNVLSALESAGANQRHVVRLAIYVVQGNPVGEAFAAAQEVWGPHPTAITVLLVAGLANPSFLVEIEAMAALD
jgi:enamine deaminase RidA (YjgF/YER057c/UK114 family)